MAFTNEDYLPTFEEIEVPELEVTSSVLRAGAHHFGKYCDKQCKEYMLCVKESPDPRKCLEEGKEVTRCGFEFYGKVKNQCCNEFMKYFECIDRSDRQMSLKNCRETQKKFDACIKETLGQDRPPLGYFSRPRVHHTERCKPELTPQCVPQSIPDVPCFEKAPDPENKYGYFY